MTAMLWKEFREQRVIWVAFALAGLGFVFGVAPLLSQDEGGQLLAALVLCWAYGLVCGSMLLAGEREEGTLRFLDSLPGDRWGLWQAKFFAGMLFTLSLAGLYVAFLVGAERTKTEWQVLPLPLIPVCAVIGLAWGMCGGARADTVLGSIGRVLFALFVLLPGLYLLLVLPLGLIEKALLGQVTPFVPAGLAVLLFVLAPLPLSIQTFTAIDRGRRRPVVRGMKRDRLPTPYGVMFGLAFRRMWLLLLALVLLAIPGGVVVAMGGSVALNSEGVTRFVAGPGVWIGLSALAGVVIGAMLFADEQAGPRRFLVEQRFPLGPLWWTRVLTGFVGLTAVWLILLLPTFVAAVNQHSLDAHNTLAGFGTRFLGETIPPPTYLLLWPATGFACGIVAGLLFRKPIVAIFVGMLATLLLVAVWMPSLVTGGLTLWQTLAPVAAIVGLSRALMHPWASDALDGGSGVRRFLVGGLAVGLLIVGGLAWRVLAVPHVPEPAGMADYLAKLPDGTENEGGALTRRACEHVAYQARPYYTSQAEGEMAHIQLLGEAIVSGWPNQPGLDAWMDEQMKGEWVELLGQAAEKPTGVALDSRSLTYGQGSLVLEGVYPASLLLAADGLRKKDGVFVEHLGRALSMARNLGEHGPGAGVGVARVAESVQWSALDVWLGRVKGDRELLRRTAHHLWRHRVPKDDQAGRLGDYLIACNSLDRPQEFYVPFVAQHTRPTPDELSLLAGAFQVPWERARQMRLLRVAYFDPAAMPGHPRYPLRAVIPLPNDDRGSPKRRLLEFEAARLKVALRLYEAENGKPAASLDDLASPAPDDPFGTRKLRYRVKDGQGVFWSVGEDGKDDGGMRPCPIGHKSTQPGEDIVFVVPRAGQKPE